MIGSQYSISESLSVLHSDRIVRNHVLLFLVRCVNRNMDFATTKCITLLMHVAVRVGIRVVVFGAQTRGVGIHVLYDFPLTIKRRLGQQLGNRLWVPTRSGDCLLTGQQGRVCKECLVGVEVALSRTNYVTRLVFLLELPQTFELLRRDLLRIIAAVADLLSQSKLLL